MRLILIYRPTKVGRLSRPRHCSHVYSPCRNCPYHGFDPVTSHASGKHATTRPMWRVTTSWIVSGQRQHHQSAIQTSMPYGVFAGCFNARWSPCYGDERLESLQHRQPGLQMCLIDHRLCIVGNWKKAVWPNSPTKAFLIPKLFWGWYPRTSIKNGKGAEDEGEEGEGEVASWLSGGMDVPVSLCRDKWQPKVAQIRVHNNLPITTLNLFLTVALLLKSTQ